jgi:hypothetical protein
VKDVQPGDIVSFDGGLTVLERTKDGWVEVDARGNGPCTHDWAWVPPAPKPWKARLIRLGFSLFAAVLLTGAWAYSLVWLSETPWVALPVGMLFWGVSYEVSKGVR